MAYKDKAKAAEYARQWRKNHPDAVRAADQKKREKPGGKEAATDRMRRWRAANPERAKEHSQKYKPTREKRRLYEAEYRAANRERHRKRDAVWSKADRAANPLKYRERHLMKYYGLSLAAYDKMVVDQHGACASCRKPQTNLHVDHCHETGRVRGLLCSKCNTAIGLFGEDIALMERAALYLEGKPLPPL